VTAAARPVRRGVEAFLQGVLDHPANAARWQQLSPAGWETLPADLWREGLLLVYRLLFTLHAEASGLTRPARHGGHAPPQDRLRGLFAGLEDSFPDQTGGLCDSRLFRRVETPLLEACAWGDAGCARLVDGVGRIPISQVENLGQVHEALLHLEPGLAREPMVRLRRGCLEVVVPAARAAAQTTLAAAGKRRRVRTVEDVTPRPGSPGQFYLRPGLGRKTSGSYYTPPELARLLVRETLAPQAEALSPADDPRPRDLLTFTVLDPAMGSGHFLIEACRFLGERLDEACRTCAARGLGERLPPELAALLTSGRPAPELRTACKGLVAARCLYGVDRNPLVVELARASLWLEAGAAPSWSLLERRLVPGDSLTDLSFETAFPEVFHPQRSPGRGPGFDAVLCNPPWEALRPAEKEFFAAYDLGVLDAPTARERSARIAELRQDPEIGPRWAAYCDAIERQKACHDRLYRHQKVLVGNDLAGRYSDSYRVFAERAAGLVHPGGDVGLLLPAAFHANEGATGIRRFYLEEMALRCCYSFENRRRLFPIDNRIKFAVVVARRGGPTTDFPCAFYLQDPACLDAGHEPLRYSLEFVRRTGGEYLTFVEARSRADLEVLTQLLARGRSLHSLEVTHGVVFRTEPYAFNVTTHGHLFTPAASPLPPGCLPLLEGKSFHQFTDAWERPRYAVSVDAAAGRPAALANARLFRLAFRTIAHATNERTAIATVLPPGVLVANSVAIEAAPERRPNAVALWVCMVLNTFAFDLSVRVRGGANMNLFLMRAGLLPAEVPEAFLAHAALRLVCNHADYAPLWREQLGDAWREPSRPAGDWPVLATAAERWQLRAAADAVVAAACGLSREQYVHMLGTFRHRGEPAMPAWCLECFDELGRIGIDAFCRRHDPYGDLGRNPTLPENQSGAQEPLQAGEGS
jgi:hypothetical protein